MCTLVERDIDNCQLWSDKCKLQCRLESQLKVAALTQVCQMWVGHALLNVRTATVQAFELCTDLFIMIRCKSYPTF